MGGWNEFIKHNSIQWNKIIVAGYSQGSGHAAYIGHHYHVNRILLFSGPQDYRAVYHSSAKWLSQKSKTPASSFFAFLHIKDPFDVNKQMTNCSVLMHTGLPNSAIVMPGAAVFTHKHILVSTIVTDNPHGSTLFPVFKNVWEYMLTAK